MEFHNAHLTYCTNIHPAESWSDTFNALKNHTLEVRRQLTSNDQPFGIGLRLSATAAIELLEIDDEYQPFRLRAFKNWLSENHCYVFTINGFPYGSFHDTRVKEQVYLPDWTSEDRLHYTNHLAIILSELISDNPLTTEGSISTLPGSFKPFHADESKIFAHLYSCAGFLESMSQRTQKDLHLGLEPEPLGHFENTEETIEFFARFHQWAQNIGFDCDVISQRIGVNYDTCHFAMQFDDCHKSLDALQEAGIRISKVHLSNALTFPPDSPEAISAIKPFIDPVYLHQVIIQNSDSSLTRYQDLPDFFSENAPNDPSEAQSNHPLHSFNDTTSPEEETPGALPHRGRIHFHIPLYADPLPPLSSTKHHTRDALTYLRKHPNFCSHFEIETYTWNVLPSELQIPINDQIVREYQWIIKMANI